MKALKILVLFLPLVGAYAQNNTFPTSGNVGIGTTNAWAPLTLSKTGSTDFGELAIRYPVNESMPDSGYSDTDRVLRLAFYGFNAYSFDSTGSGIEAYTHNNGVDYLRFVTKRKWGGGNVDTFTYLGIVDSGYPDVNQHLSVNTQDLMWQSVFYVNADHGKNSAIFNGGNVGIGTDSPGSTLDVAGTIRAEEVIVEAGTSDYVFEDGYELRSLSEVEEHIEKYGHLPGVPSESEVESGGVSLGDSQRILLEKVEELTLYMIDLKKENEEQRMRLEGQEKEIAVLKKYFQVRD